MNTYKKPLNSDFKIIFLFLKLFFDISYLLYTFTNKINDYQNLPT